MGVPSLFTYLLHNCYQKLIIKQKLNHSVNNLFIDGNGILHNACNEILLNYENLFNSNKNFIIDYNILENNLINNCIKKLFDIIIHINPTNLVYIAIDGVCPNSKIIQQRLRRYKSFYDNSLINPIKQKYNKFISQWSSVNITPGTPFMKKLNIELNKYINQHSNQFKFKIIYSSFEEPGEGEHKIIQFIKHNINIYENIVINGLDADLIFLSLTLRNKYIFLMRNLDNTDNLNKDDLKYPYEYVCIHNLKHNIINLIINHNHNLKFDFKLLYDFIFISFLIGNDFLFHSPLFNIYDKGLDIIINTYANLKETNDFLIQFDKNNNVSINMIFFDEFLHNLIQQEQELFNNLNNDITKKRNLYFKNKIEKEYNSLNGYNKEIYYINNFINSKNIFDNIISFEDYKFKYYEHFEFNSNQRNLIDNMCLNYLEGILWTTKYYFNSLSFWNWYYKFNISPFICDLSKFIQSNKFNINHINLYQPNDKPLRQNIQLLCVIPKQYLININPDLKKYIEDKRLSYMFPDKFDLETENEKLFWKCKPKLPIINFNLLNNIVI